MAVLASAVWRVRCAGQSGGVGNNANGGGYDSGIAGAATDYSQQSAAQATGTLGTASGTTTFTDAGAVFTSAMVGNALFIASGAGFTVGAYFITTYTSATQVTLDRSPGTGTVAVWKIGGAWAEPWTNTTNAIGYIAKGNTVYIGGAGTDNPSSADYTKSGGGFVTPLNGDSTAGYVRFIGENGRPRLSSDGLMYYVANFNSFENIYFSTSGTSNGGLGIVNGSTCLAINCVFDQNGKNMVGTNFSGSMLGCEVYSSTANAGAAGANAGVLLDAYGTIIENCNIHECWGPGLSMGSNASQIFNTVISKNTGNGIELTGGGTSLRGRIAHCTIDGNKGHGINAASAGALQAYDCYSNLITNQNQASKYGINVAAGTAAVNDRIKSVWDYNHYYNNTANFNGISAGPHDNVAGTDPRYTDQSTQDYSLQSSSPVIGKGFPSAATYAVPGASPAPMSTVSPLVPRRKVSPDVTNYMDAGGIQKVMASGGGGMLVHPGLGGGARG